jgi:hypothetical protein
MGGILQQKLPLSTRKLLFRSWAPDKLIMLIINSYYIPMKDLHEYIPDVSIPLYIYIFPLIVPHIFPGWWLTYPSEKYESPLGLLFPKYGKS